MEFHRKKNSQGRAKWHALMTIIAVLILVNTGCGIEFGQTGGKSWERGKTTGKTRRKLG